MNRWLKGVVLGLLVVAPLAQFAVGAEAFAGERADLPAGVPADFPFPDGADLTTRTTQLSGVKQIVVSATFSKSPNVVYRQFKDYATGNGYAIAMENEESHQFTARKSARNGLVVRIADMGSIKVATVSFTVPSK